VYGTEAQKDAVSLFPLFSYLFSLFSSFSLDDDDDDDETAAAAAAAAAAVS